MVRTTPPRSRVSGRGRVVNELSCDGQSVPFNPGHPDSATSCGVSPLTRIPLRSHAAAAACPSTPVPPAIRRAGHPAPPLKGHDIGSLLCHARDLAPRPVANCTPDLSPGPRGSPHAAAQWPLRKRPRSRATATWRSVPLRCVDRAAARLRRGTWDTFRCRLTPNNLSGNATLRRRMSTVKSSKPSLLQHYPRVYQTPCRIRPGCRFCPLSLPDSRDGHRRCAATLQRPATTSGSDGALRQIPRPANTTMPGVIIKFSASRTISTEAPSGANSTRAGQISCSEPLLPAGHRQHRRRRVDLRRQFAESHVHRRSIHLFLTGSGRSFLKDRSLTHSFPLRIRSCSHPSTLPFPPRCF